MRNLLDSFIFILLTTTVGTLVFVYTAGAVVAQMTFPGDLAQIEQLRRDVQRVNVAQSEDVIGQVTKWNQVIMSNKQYNKIWWADLTIPDEWDNVELIEIP